VKAYGKALQKYGFRTYQGEDASGQPADMADVFPHETAAGCKMYNWASPVTAAPSEEKANRAHRAVVHG
jgi:hypothetical protein